MSLGLLALNLGAQPILTTLLVQKEASGSQWWGLGLRMSGLLVVLGDRLFDGKISVIGMISACLSLFHEQVSLCGQGG
ncbi:hypothetical protein [Laceyella putida]|uniref:Uncharacterized protein n=1 Tax=Laceyella putida TaxID=110101 RepID=A0ABW2RIK9_9BACL